MNKVALIIGGSSGIGFELSKRLLKNQYIVYNVSRRASLLDGVNNIVFDVVNKQKEIIEKIKEKKIDLLIYSAGFSMASPLESVNEVDYEYLFDVNYFGLLKILKEVVPMMKQNSTIDAKSKIVVFSSVGSFLPIPFDTFYSSSKMALNLLVREINFELNRFYIYASSILIPTTRTQFSFKRKINSVNNRAQIDYFDFEDAYQILMRNEQQGYSAEKVSKKIYQVIKSKKLKTKTIIGFKYKIFNVLSRILTDNMIDKLIKKHYHLR